jgi:hypothetical protein
MIIDDLYYIFHEALQDRKAIETKTSKVHSVIANGIKIQKFSDRIEILNMGKGGDLQKYTINKNKLNQIKSKYE